MRELSRKKVVISIRGTEVKTVFIVLVLIDAVGSFNCGVELSGCVSLPTEPNNLFFFKEGFAKIAIS